MKHLKLLILLFIFIVSCTSENKKFVLLSPEETGITFNNKIIETSTMNPLTYIYMYNGGGVSAGDINNDGLPDLFFAGNMVDSKLYLNQGNMKFKDITTSSGIIKKGWATGVNFIDINTDGYLDIYICIADKDYTGKHENQLYINQGDHTFIEQAKAYGLNDTDYSTQSVFFDYDKDGDLDMYLLTNGIETFSHNNTRPRKIKGEGKSTDKLYRNNGDQTFTDISEIAGITIEGYGLGVGILDINKDGWPDVYCANDFVTNDLLWLNNGNGTFTESIRKYITHTSHNGMGMDIADFNNDGLLDIIEMDMLPESNKHNKTMTPAMNYNNQTMRFNLDYMPQYVRNTLQLQNTNHSFSEIGRLAKIHKTDWSWAPLFADLDNDGYKDLFISNGYGRDITDLDFIVYSKIAQNPFGTKKVREESAYAELNKLPEINLPNYFFQNTGTINFNDATQNWSTAENSMSNGAIYVDLDLDGDLDLVTNNVNKEAFIYKNTSVENHENKTNYLKIKLEGPAKNLNGIGTKIFLFTKGKMQKLEQYPVRGYLSSVDYTLHFGIGDAKNIDSLQVIWPDNSTQILYDIATNVTLPLDFKDAVNKQLFSKNIAKTLLTNKSEKVDFIKHSENSYIDFLDQPLLLKMLSREGPGIAAGDIDNDGLDDVLLSSALQDTTYVWLQKENGNFVKGSILPDSWKFEQLGCLIFDTNQDNLVDVYITSGGNEFSINSKFYQDQLYVQQTDGSFIRSNNLPEIFSSTATVNACDYDKDGDLDLFVGSRLKPKSYPYPGTSYILENNQGVFKNSTDDIAPEISKIGLVTAALWTDFNNDGATDLIIVGEWMEISFFKNQNGKLINITSNTGIQGLTGFWNSINGADFDNDGDIDYVIGNLGTNSELKATKEEPVSILSKDFDENGSIDPVIGYYVQGENYPYPSRDALVNQINAMKRRFPFYKNYGDATYNKLFKKEELAGALRKEVSVLQTLYINNKGDGTFTYKYLPLAAQRSPTYGISITDVNDDTFLDILLTGNRRDSETLSGFLDGSIGTTLVGNGKGSFTAIPVDKSSFYTPWNSRGILKLMSVNNTNFLVANNDGELASFERSRKSKTIPIKEDDIYALVTFKNGKTRKVEFYFGSGYLTQDSRKLEVPTNTSAIYIVNSQNLKRKIL